MRGLSAAHKLSKNGCTVTVVDAAPRAGGLVADSFLTPGGRRAEAGQHGFWDEYNNIFRLIDELNLPEDPLTGYAEQGQYSPRGLEAVWPVYREKQKLPSGLGQALYTRFLKLAPWELATAAPLTAAFSEFDDSPAAWDKYDEVSFRDLCVKLGVSSRLYREAFEPMILTGLFAPGSECSAAAALGMAYFFVLKSQTAFDVRWCRGNVGEKIFQPWVEQMESRGVEFVHSSRAVGFESEAGEMDKLTAVRCRDESGEERLVEADSVVFAVGASALAGLVRGCPLLAQHEEWRRFANLRGTSVLATRIFLDRPVRTPYSANACWGFDEGVGMTWFDIRKLHAPALEHEPGAVLEVDYYHANPLLALSDTDIITKAKRDLDTMLGAECSDASVTDAAVVRLPNAVNWYFPGSYREMPETRSSSFRNVYFVGDIVRSRHGSWSQEKAFVTGVEAANAVLGRELSDGVLPLAPDEPHVAAGRQAVAAARGLFSRAAEDGVGARGPSLVDFLW